MFELKKTTNQIFYFMKLIIFNIKILKEIDRQFFPPHRFKPTI